MMKMRAWLASACLAAAMFGCGGPEPMPVDGGSDAASREDGGPDGGRDPCDGLTACTTVGTTCDGDDLVTCAVNADGCMAESTVRCTTDDQVCDDSSGTAACVDPCSLIPAAERCDTLARACTDGDTLEVCAANADGCYVRTVTECGLMPGGVCDDADMPMCVTPADPCAGTPDACTTAGTSCDGESLVTCAPNAFGCLVETTADCTSRAGGLCDEAAAVPACVFTGDPCTGITECTAPAEPSCLGGPELVTCAADAFGCMVETRVDCTEAAFGFCDETATGPDSCATAATDPCMGTTECGTAASLTCSSDGTALVDCAPNAFGCFVETRTTCAGSCSAAGGTAECIDPAPGCPEAAARVINCTSGTVSGDTMMGTMANTGDYGDCYAGTNYAGREQYWRFEHTGTAPVEVTIATSNPSSTSDFDLFVLDGAATACTAADPICLAGSRDGGGLEEVVFRADPADVAWVAYDLWSAATGTTTYDLTVTCAPIVCGDGAVVTGETCDDGNTTPGDGCSATCEREAGYSCTGAPSVCTYTCGNGIIDSSAGETCDDGGTASGNGCSATCTVEPNYVCTGTPSTCVIACGNGVVNTSIGETCDDGGTADGNGCSATCTIEAGYVCTGAPSTCVLAPPHAFCTGARVVTTTATFTAEDITLGGPRPTGTGCGTGSGTRTLYYAVTVPAMQTVQVTTSGSLDRVLFVEDSCTATACTYATDSAPESATLTNPTSADVTRIVGVRPWGSGTASYNITFQYTVCGDGALSAGETCDDGNAVGGDGCSAACTIETGYVCAGTPSVCLPPATNGTCTGARAVTEPSGTDTVAFTSEDLRAGAASGRTGCGTGSDTTALFYTVTIPPATAATITATPTGTTAWNLVLAQTADCAATTCGTVTNAGTTGAPESRRIVNSTGAPVTHTFLVRSATATFSTFDIAFTYAALGCGDGFVDAPETCDDGGTSSGNGCSSTCEVEAGYACSGTPSMCRPLPMNRTCATATPITTTTSILDESTFGGGPLPGTSCGFGSGTETLYYSVTIPPGATVRALTAPDNDIVLMTQNACGDPACASSTDSSPEQATFTNSGTSAITRIVAVRRYGTGTATYDISFTYQQCGDGVIGGTEGCDDGGLVSGDGCSATCAVELGYSCTGSPSVCAPPVCGNSIVEIGEGCDDGGTTGGDGCSASCAREIAASGSSVTVTGALTAGDPDFSRPYADCTARTGSGFNYDAITITNTTGASRTIDVEADWDVDGFLLIYRQPFDPAAPTMNCAAGDDDGGIGSLVSNFTIAAGESVVIVATTFSPDVTTPWSIQIRTD